MTSVRDVSETTNAEELLRMLRGIDSPRKRGSMNMTSKGAETVVYKPKAAKRALRGRVCIETVTPEMATALLNANENNRPLRQGHLDNLARAQREGRWRLTNDAITVTGDSFENPGRVINGQHRLYACIESGTPIDVVVLFGADEDSYAVLDSGIKRQARDSISEKNAAIKAAVARMVLEYERGQVRAKSRGNGSVAPSNDEVVRAYHSRPAVARVVEAYMLGLKKLLRSPVGVLSAAAIFTEADAEDGHRFLSALIDGEGLKAGPVLALRNRLISDTARGRVAAPATMVLTLKAWNAHRSGAGHVRAQLRDDDRAPPVVGYPYNPGTR